jgi:hypothetical protein
MDTWAGADIMAAAGVVIGATTVAAIVDRRTAAVVVSAVVAAVPMAADGNRAQRVRRARFNVLVRDCLAPHSVLREKNSDQALEF